MTFELHREIADLRATHRVKEGKSGNAGARAISQKNGRRALRGRAERPSVRVQASISLNFRLLKPETDKLLHRAARKEGITKSEFVERAIQERLARLKEFK